MNESSKQSGELALKEISLIIIIIMAEANQTKSAQQKRWEDMIESEDFKRACREDCWNVSDKRLNEIKLDCFRVSENARRLAEEAYVKEQLERIHKANNPQGLLVHISLDQNQTIEEAITNQYCILEHIREANYSWLIDAHAVFEYWSKKPDEEELHFNPHIHFCVRKTVKPSVIKQHLQRKLVQKKLNTVYRVEVSPQRHFELCLKYIEGDKIEDKDEACEKDFYTREEHNVLHINRL